MYIKSFRIKNYRSIKDSGECYISSDNVTILAGKTEAGKTTILQALEDFNINREIREEALPINNEGSKPEIRVTYIIDEGKLEGIYEEIGLGIKTRGPTEVQITKKYPSEYILPRSSLSNLGIKHEQLFKPIQKDINNIYKIIKDIHLKFPQISGTLPEIDFEDSMNSRARLKDFKRNTEPNLAEITNEDMRANFNGALEEIINKMTELNNLKSAEGKLVNEIKKRIPNFILFSSFDDVFPSEVPLDEASHNELIRDLQTISNLDLELIKSRSSHRKAEHKRELNIRLEEDYKNFWTQDLTNLSIDWDSEKLLFLLQKRIIIIRLICEAKGSSGI